MAYTVSQVPASMVRQKHTKVQRGIITEHLDDYRIPQQLIEGLQIESPAPGRFQHGTTLFLYEIPDCIFDLGYEKVNRHQVITRKILPDTVLNNWSFVLVENWRTEQIIGQSAVR
ncbi:MAG: hypothetical protein V1784_04635 [bacterium]